MDGKWCTLADSGLSNPPLSTSVLSEKFLQISRSTSIVFLFKYEYIGNLLLDEFISRSDISRTMVEEWSVLDADHSPTMINDKMDMLFFQ